MHCFEHELMRNHLLALSRRLDPVCDDDPERLSDVLDAYRIDGFAALAAQPDGILDLMAREVCAAPPLAA